MKTETEIKIDILRFEEIVKNESGHRENGGRALCRTCDECGPNGRCYRSVTKRKKARIIMTDGAVKFACTGHTDPSKNLKTIKESFREQPSPSARNAREYPTCSFSVRPVRGPVRGARGQRTGKNRKKVKT